jgi:hypothetical protein
LIETSRDRLFSGMGEILDGPLPLRDKLRSFGLRLATTICSDEVIRAQRMIIGMAERMPELTGRFYDSGSKNRLLLAKVLERESRAGTLVISDPELCSQQFIELMTAGLWRSRLFGKSPTPPTEQEIAGVVDAAVAMFLTAYSPAKPG